MNTLGNQLSHAVHKYRKDAGLNVAELSKLAAVSPATIARLEAGDIRRLRLAELLRLASVLKLRFRVLVTAKRSKMKKGT